MVGTTHDDRVPLTQELPEGFLTPAPRTGFSDTTRRSEDHERDFPGKALETNPAPIHRDGYVEARARIREERAEGCWERG